MPRDLPTPTRRTVLLTTGTALTGLAGLAYHTSEPATALTVSGLDVTPTDRTLGPNDEIAGVTLSISLDYDYSSTHPPDAVTATVYVNDGAGGSFSELASHSVEDPAQSDSGTVSLSADLFDTEAFDASMFEVAEGATRSVDVAVKCILDINRDGQRIGQADIADTAVVTISREEMTVSASIAGEGALSVAVA